MIKSKKDFNILDYQHSRDNNYKTTADELFLLINNFSDQSELSIFYNYFEKRYKLPKIVVKQTLRQYFANSYEYKSGNFNFKLKIRNIPKSILYYFSLIYALLFNNNKKKLKKFNLIIDLITSSIEMKRWEKLLNLFGPENVLCITRNLELNNYFPIYNFYNKKLFRNINISYLFTSIYN